MNSKKNIPQPLSMNVDRFRGVYFERRRCHVRCPQILRASDLQGYLWFAMLDGGIIYHSGTGKKWKPNTWLSRCYIVYVNVILNFLTALRVRGSNPGGGEIVRTRPDRPWGPPSLLSNGYRVSFPGVKRPGRGVDHSPSSSVCVIESVELYLYSPSGPSWLVLGRTLSFLLR
jgi:hypothetical protein